MTVVEAKIDQVGELLLNLSQETGLNLPQITDELMELLLRSGDNTPYAAFFNNGDVAKITNFAGDLKTGGAELVRGMAGDVGFFRAWDILSGRTGLRTQIDALSSLSRIRQNPKLAQVFPGKTADEIDQILGSIWGAPNVSYSQMIDDLEVAIEALPMEKTKNFWKVIADGQRGLVNKNNVWDRRHSWLTLKKIKENEAFLKNADEIKFEVELEQIAGISNAVPDILITKSTASGAVKMIIGEVKAGDNVITSNFNSQSLRYFQEIADIRDLRLFRRDDVSLTKQEVIDSWKGGVTSDQKVRDLFTDYYNEISDVELDATFTQAQLENFLTMNNDWFDLVFNSSF